MSKDKRSTRRLWTILLLCLLVIAAVGTLLPVQGRTYTEVSRQLGPARETNIERVAFEVENVGVPLRYDVYVKLQEGIAAVTILAPDGSKMLDVSGADFTVIGPKEDEKRAAGKYTLEITWKEAVGTLRVAVYDKNRRTGPNMSRVITGKLMILVGVLAVWLCKRRFKPQWRYFIIGGALWTCGVTLKFAWAFLLNAPIFSILQESFSPTVSTIIGALYIGLLTGVFEIGVTVIAARQWRSLTANASRGIAVGIGAGAAEAISLGIAVLVPAMFWPNVVSSRPEDVILLTILLPVTERVLALLCHTASRAAVLFAAATRKVRWAFAGFALLTGVDVVAGVFLLHKGPTRISTWYLELALVPFALISIGYLIMIIKRWPPSTSPSTYDTASMSDN
jgi:hypothetical protein